jgi:hypothetical protein
MKQRGHVYIFFLGILSLISFSGCFQYPEGPVFTLQLKDERLSGTWLLTEYTDTAGNNTIAEHQNQTLTVIVDRSGNRSWAQFNNGLLQTHATFQFAAHSNYLIVEYDVIVPDNVALQVFYDVKKLTDKEFKYVDEKGNTLDYKKY